MPSFKSFVKYDRAWKYSLNIWLFIFFYSFLISFENFSRSFNGNIFLLDLGVSNTFGLIAVLGVDSDAGSGVISGVDSSVGSDVQTLCFDHIMLLKLLGTFLLVPRNNPTLFREDLFSNNFTSLPMPCSLSIPFNLLCSLSAFIYLFIYFIYSLFNVDYITIKN